MRGRLLPRVLGGVALASTLLFASTHARAEATGIVVSTEECVDIDAGEVERLLGLEFGQVAERWQEGELRVELRCDGRRLRIAAFDPVTKKRLESDVDLGPRKPGRDRTVALLVSQLVLVSWADILRAVPPAEKVAPAAPRAPLRATEAPPREPPAGARWELRVAAGPRVRDLGAPILDGFASARPALLFGSHARVFLDLGYERGSAARAGGSVALTMASFGAGAAWRSPRLGIVGLEAGASLSAAYVSMAGRDASPAFAGTSAQGLVGQLAMGAGPVFYVDRFSVGLEIGGGVTFPRAVAHTTGDRDVSMGGAWGGAALVLGAFEAAP